MTPFYQQDGITIYRGDCRELLPRIDAESVSLVLSDPPCGVSEQTNRASRRHGNLCASNDPHLLKFPRLILFGANYYAERLPPSPSWIVWDKLDGLTTTKRPIGFDDNADVELAWSNCGGGARLIPHRWKGMIKASEVTERRVHPTQKPVALMAQLIEWRTKPGDLILDPYMGGATVIAAKQTGRRAIGIEIEERYCEVAANRLRQGELFGVNP